jgi:hypothetical protein
MSSTHLAPTLRVPLAAAGAALVLTGCAQDNPIADEGTEVPGGRAAPDAPVDDDVKVLEVVLPHPDDGVYSVGEDAPLTVSVANDGRAPDTLLDVSGPDFGGAVDADGGEFSIAIPEDDNLFVTEGGEHRITLLDLERDLRSSESIAVTFEFAEAGAVTIDAVVAPAP